MRFIPSDKRWWVLAMGVLIGTDTADLIAEDKPAEPAAIVRVEAKVLESLRVNLSLSANTVKAGQPFPTFSVELANASKEPLTVMLPIDGCEIGWRIVQYEWRVTDASGKVMERKGLARCGNTNPIRKEDFVTLEPGKSRSLQEGNIFLMPANMLHALDKPGKYRIQLHYSFDPRRPNKGLPLGADDPQVAGLAEKAAVISVASNTVEIEITE